jgi:hypothetical protein
MKHPPTSTHNYLAKITELAELALIKPTAAIRIAEIHHDTWCDFFRGRGFCNCEPIVKLSRPQ